MKLLDITYLILETIRKNHIIDDERLDPRLIADWIKMKRSQYIKNMRGGGGNGGLNPNNRISLDLYQKLEVTIEVTNPVTDAGDYPYTDAITQLYKIVESVSEIPHIMESKGGLLIMSIESEDEMKLPFSHVSYDQMRFSGNGRFNTGLIFGAVRDNKLWFKYNEFFDTYTTVYIRAIFDDPTEVAGFDELVDDYPADSGLIEYIKNGIFDKDIRMLFSGKADEINDASGEIKE